MGGNADDSGMFDDFGEWLSDAADDDESGGDADGFQRELGGVGDGIDFGDGHCGGDCVGISDGDGDEYSGVDSGDDDFGYGNPCGYDGGECGEFDLVHVECFGDGDQLGIDVELLDAGHHVAFGHGDTGWNDVDGEFDGAASAIDERECDGDAVWHGDGDDGDAEFEGGGLGTVAEDDPAGDLSSDRGVTGEGYCGIEHDERGFHGIEQWDPVFVR